MAITFHNGVGTNIEGIILRVSSSQGPIMPTIGPPNGVGKLNQPGTRGLVADDFGASHPYIYTIANASSTNVSAPSAAGYLAVRYKTDTQLEIQDESLIDSSLYGMRSFMQSTLNGTVGNSGTFFMPCPKTASGYNYLFDTSRYGNKPVSGTYSTYNQAGVRGISTPNKTIYKWEAHILVSIWNSYKDSTGGQIATNWIERMVAVHIPVFANNTWYRYTPTLEHYHNSASLETNYCFYKYFVGEYSGNLPGNTFIGSPVIWSYPHIGSDNISRPTIYVQTKYCFKDD